MSDTRIPQEPGEELKRLVAEICNEVGIEACSDGISDESSERIRQIEREAVLKIENYIQSRIPEVSEEANPIHQANVRLIHRLLEKEEKWRRLGKWAESHLSDLEKNWENEYEFDTPESEGRLGSAAEYAINKLAELRALLSEKS